MESSAVFLKKGELLYSLRRWQSAASEFQQCIARNPEFAYAHARLALCALHQKLDDLALAEALEAIKLEPQSAYNHYVHAFILKTIRRFSEASEAIKIAKSLDPENATYYAEEAHIKLRHGHITESVELSRSAMQIDPSCGYARWMYAVALNAYGDTETAIQVAESVLSEAPDDTDSHSLSASIYSRKYSDATNFLAIQARDTEERLRLHEARIVENVELLEKAIHHYQEALRLDPSHFLAKEGLISVYQSEFTAAQVALKAKKDKYLDTRLDDAMLDMCLEHLEERYLRVWALAQLNFHEPAAAVLDQVAGSGDESLESRALKGWIAMRRNDLELARQEFSEVLLVDATHKWARMGLEKLKTNCFPEVSATTTKLSNYLQSSKFYCDCICVIVTILIVVYGVILLIHS